MATAQIIVDVVQVDEERSVADWFVDWQSKLASVSEDLGCGCCVHIWEVEGPLDVLRLLPADVIAFPGIEE